MPAPKNNQFAAKAESEKLSARVWVDMTPADKAKLVKAAAGEKLGRWSRARLLEAAETEKP